MMAKTRLPPIHILLTPLGSTVDIILAPLDRWKPEIIYAFTSMDSSIQGVEENLRYAWNINCGPNGPPDVRKVSIEEPWLGNTVQNVMAEFDRVIENTLLEFPNREIKWHVSVTGGTNLMAIGMALSATTHLMEVYYTLPGDKHPELRAHPSKLVVDIPLFEHLGPAVHLLRKSATKVKLYEIIKKSPNPITVDRMVRDMGTTDKAVYAQLKPLIDCGLVVKGDGSTYSTTTTGDLAYQRWKGSPQS
jgi:hypothetical protein